MEARAHLRYARIAPRKVSVVLDLIRDQDLDKALAILQYTPKAASELLLKLVKSAAANAENNHNMDKNNLYVAECFVTDVYKRQPQLCSGCRMYIRLPGPCVRCKGVACFSAAVRAVCAGVLPVQRGVY